MFVFETRGDNMKTIVATGTCE